MASKRKTGSGRGVEGSALFRFLPRYKRNPYQDPTLGNHNSDVFFAVRPSLTAKRNRSQYRLRFAKTTAGDNMTDLARLRSGNSAHNKPVLNITYLLP
ncbi:hypothetical protein [Deinococcus marmoris]|uniref:Uncharacterized protein n=1 Tax=Deinococcus marmoris TaxID=249408 RepID=A0A1U7P1W3_9DEIO|nr:hypothetical protein [Deinococcus marmoris]OLV19154.1 hypothetical protein BOO71_0003538 [Deinococcus marmoris]